MLLTCIDAISQSRNALSHYYGRYYRTALNGLLQRIDTYLVRWARRKYKRLRSYKKARKWWDGLTAQGYGKVMK
jgi:hypothetical protein